MNVHYKIKQVWIVYTILRRPLSAFCLNNIIQRKIVITMAVSSEHWNLLLKRTHIHYRFPGLQLNKSTGNVTL